MPEIVDDPRYQQAIAGIRGQLTGGAQGTGGVTQRASPDEQEEYYDSIKEMLLQQGLEESAPKKKEKGGFDFRHLIPGYTQGFIQKQQLDQRNELVKLDQQRQKGAAADRQLKMRQQLEEIRLKREERQQRQAVGSALNQLQQGGLDPQATQELQGQVRQGLVGIGAEREALAFGQQEEGSIQEQAFRESLRQGKTPLEAYRDVQEAGRAPAAPPSPETQAFQSAVQSGMTPMEAFRQLRDKPTSAARFGVEREAIAEEVYQAPFAELKQDQRRQVNQRVLDQKVQVATANRAQAPIPAELANRLGSADAGVAIANDIFQLYNPAFTGPAVGRAGSVKQILGLSKDDEVQFRQSTLALGEMVIRSRTGAQASEAEMQRLLQQLPSVNDQPAVFMSKLRAVTRQIQTQRESIAGAAALARGDAGGTGPQPLFDVRLPVGKTITRQQVQQKLKPGWTLEQAVQWYEQQGYEVR